MVADSTAPEWRISREPVSYHDALRVMEERATSIRADSTRELIWLLQHPPLYTAGTSARETDLLNAENFPTFKAGRGGEWTYHGPGQQIAYVMLDLSRPHGLVPARDVHAYVAGLEAWLINTLTCFGVSGVRRPGRVGVWTENSKTGREAKIGAIGVRVTRWVTWHGVSLNVAPNLAHYEGIVPCGLRDFQTTSLAALGVEADMADVSAAMRSTWAETFS